MMATSPVTPSLRPAGTSGAATLRTSIVKIISPPQNDVRRLRCACVLGIKRARRVLRDKRLEKFFAL